MHSYYKTAKVKPNNCLATHRPVVATLACSEEHYELRIKTQPKIPSKPPSPTGPYNKYADRPKAEQATDRDVLATHIASNAGLPAKATKQAHVLHNVAYKMFVDTAGTKLEHHVRPPGGPEKQKSEEGPYRKGSLQTAAAKHTPIQLRSETLPYKWLQEQGHLYYQHLL